MHILNIPTQSELEWLSHHYPDMYWDTDCQELRGELAFRMTYDSDDESHYIINPNASTCIGQGILIEDVYKVDIVFWDAQFLPEVWEIGGRIKATQKKWGIDNLVDLHVYSKGDCCLCILPELDQKLPNGFNLEDFFHRLLVPYFYYQSYYEQFGQEPWRGYSHNDAGYLESYLYRQNTSPDLMKKYLIFLSPKTLKLLYDKKQLKGHHLCFCQSNQKFRKCHYDAMFGYEQLRKDISKMGLNQFVEQLLTHCYLQQRQEVQKISEQIGAKADYQAFRELLLAHRQAKKSPSGQ